MNFDLSLLLAIGAGYLLCLFGIAWLTERGAVAQRLIRHPLVHTLTLGAYASAWTFYGTFGIAAQSGYAYLASYIGSAITFMLAPLLLIPILRITRTYQLSSLADLFAFRFRSGRVGTITTLATLVASLPLISIQIQAVSDSLHLLNPSIDRYRIAAIFCALIALFAIIFGARHASLRRSHNGLILAIALQSLLKLLALLVIAGYAVFVYFDGPSGLDAWLTQHPGVLSTLQTPPESSGWRVMILACFAATITMPHIFHLAFTENTSSESLYKTTWLMPLFLLLLALCVPPILWAAQAQGLTQYPEFSALALGTAVGQPWLTVLALIGGFSAASGLIIVAAVALASMIQNHLVLPLISTPENVRFYAWLLWLRRFLIVLLIFACYLFFVLAGQQFKLNQLGLLSFIAFLQFLPGLIATLYWPGASRNGFLLGLGAGFLIWLFALTLPLHFDLLHLEIPYSAEQHWHLVALLSVVVNLALTILGSMLFPGKPAERQSADACVLNSLQRPLAQSTSAQQIEDLQQLLAPRLGTETTDRELQRALQQLNLAAGPLRPIDMLRLRSQLEQNLSGLLGPVEAAALLNPPTPFASQSFRAREIHLLEQQLEHYDARLSGVAAELDQLRRYHRLTLQRLPIGACTLDGELRILFWNQALTHYTGIEEQSCIDSPVQQLPPPWNELLSEFAQTDALHRPAVAVSIDGIQRWYSLHKASLDAGATQGMVLLVEDETESQQLAHKLAHQERLASIGRFAAGVAHEVGNPVTGIACLAQNLKLETDAPEILETGDQIVEQTRRISRIVQSLVRFAHTGQHQGDLEPQPVDMQELVEEAIHLIKLDSRSGQQCFSNRVPDGCIVDADPQQMLQVMVNLLNNASDASPEDGEIEVTGAVDPHQVRICIIDQGSGIAPEHIDHLFEPFFTTKEPGKGTGLGLPLVYNIITEHYGSIELFSPANNKQKNGTQVVITLPRHTQVDA